MLLIDYIEKDKTISREYYVSLEALNEATQEKCSKQRKLFLTYHDSLHFYSSVSESEEMSHKKFKCCGHW